MALIDLDILKKHVRADDYASDDDYLEHLSAAATMWLLRATNRSEDELLELGGGRLPADLQHAILLVAGHWYDQREGVSVAEMREVPYTIQAIVKPYRKLS